MERFIVSARKYRPATFASVVGQSHITTTLQNAISREQLAHAYLFCGPRGVGKTTCARIVAKTINCMNRTAQNEACNECESCVSFDSGTSYSIHELDAASNTSVENIRSLNEQVRIPPQVGKYSVYIIDEVHMLSTSAFNAFLKTLEEPPAHVIFILATTDKHKILPTILSRCQIYDFKRIVIDDVVKYLQYISNIEKVDYDDESLNMIASKADGCMRDALSMYDKVVSFCGSKLISSDVSIALNILDYDTYFGFTTMLKDGKYQDALMKYDEVLQRGFDTQSFISGLASHIRNMLIARNEQTAKLLEVTGNVAQRYTKQSKELDLEFIFKSLDILTQLESTLKSTLNQRLACEFAILKISNLSGIVVEVSSSAKNPLPRITAAEINSAQPQQIASKPQDTEVQDTEVKNSEVKKDDSQTERSIQTEPQNAVEIKSTSIVEPNTKSTNTVPKRTRKGLGIPSIKDLKSSMEQEVKAPTVKAEEIIMSISKENEQKVLDACIEYSAKIADTKTRISLAMATPTIVNGKIQLRIISSILEEEINKQKYELLNGIKDICGVTGLDFDVIIDEVENVNDKKIFAKVEEKLAFLNDKNPNLQMFMKELDLHLV